MLPIHVQRRQHIEKRRTWPRNVWQCCSMRLKHSWRNPAIRSGSRASRNQASARGVQSTELSRSLAQYVSSQSCHLGLCQRISLQALPLTQLRLSSHRAGPAKFRQRTPFTVVPKPVAEVASMRVTCNYVNVSQGRRDMCASMENSSPRYAEA